jgi:hypothetical protein
MPAQNALIHFRLPFLAYLAGATIGSLVTTLLSGLPQIETAQWRELFVGGFVVSAVLGLLGLLLPTWSHRATGLAWLAALGLLFVDVFLIRAALASKLIPAETMYVTQFISYLWLAAASCLPVKFLKWKPAS